MMYVHFQHIAFNITGPAIQRLFKTFARQYPATIPDQLQQQGKFTARKADQLVVAPHLLAFRADAKLADNNFIVLRFITATQAGTNTRTQFIQLERLDQIIVGARIKTFDTIRQGIARANNNDRDRTVAGTQLFQHLDAVEAGQSEIKQHQVEMLALQRTQYLVTAINPVDGITVSTQGTLQAIAKQRIIFNQQQSHACALPIGTSAAL